MRCAAARYGAALIALSPWRVRVRDDAAARARLDAALQLPKLIVTSPAAAKAAAALRPLPARADQQWIAVGAGTAAALRQLGIATALAPMRMDTEGLLALPALTAVAGESMALITAPGGRGELLPALQARGAHVLRADVYERVPLRLAPRALAAVRHAQAPLVVAVSSGEALQRVLAAAPATVAAQLRAGTVVVASARLGAIAATLGCSRVVVASGPRPDDLLAAAHAALGRATALPVA